MKNNIIFVIIFIAVVSAGIVSMIFLAKRGSSAVLAPKSEMAAVVTESQPPKEEEIPQANTEPLKELLKSTEMDTDYFTLVLPPGWVKTSSGESLPFIITDSTEKVTDEKAKEIAFRTGLSINSMPLGETSLSDYVETMKTSLIQGIPIIEITKEEQVGINGSAAHILEIESIQKDIKFRTVLAIFTGKDNTVWAFSFNTLDDSWNGYKDVFHNITDSIVMKQ